MAQVAREAGVSLSLVSLAFRDAYGVSEKTKEHILATAKRMNYQPNTVAARLARKADDTLGVFLLDLRNEVFVDMFDGMRASATEAGRELVLSVGSTGGELDRGALDSLIRARVDVAVAAGLLLPDEVLAKYRGRLRLVSVARVVPGFDSVDCDNRLGAALATQHLLDLGHRRILHLANRPSDGYLERRIGFEQTVRAAGLTPWVIDVDYSRDAAAAAIGPILDSALDSAQRPTAVLAHNDQMALGVLDALHERGLRAPHDLSVAGYDNTTLSRTPGIALTTVDLHAVDLGRQAAELAIWRSANPDEPVVVKTSTPTLVVRGSTGPPAD
nr:LacI family DNA-binding transcriptional regulator [Kineosphaera limosa]